MASNKSNLVAQTEEKTAFNHVEYFQRFWSYQAGAINDAELLSVGRGVGLHIWQTIHNPGGFVMRDLVKTDKQISHPFFALSEQEELTGKASNESGTKSIDITRFSAKDKPQYGNAYTRLEQLINHWPKGENANAVNTWRRYWIVCHAFRMGLLSPGILGDTFRKLAGLENDKKFAYVLDRVIDMSPDAIRLNWIKDNQPVAKAVTVETGKPEAVTVAK